MNPPSVSMTRRRQHASTEQWVKQAETKLESMFKGGKHVFNERLVCSFDDGGDIIVTDSGGQQRRFIPAGGIQGLFDIDAMDNGDFIIAASNGLHHSSNGKRQATGYTTAQTVSGKQRATPQLKR